MGNSVNDCTSRVKSDQCQSKETYSRTELYGDLFKNRVLCIGLLINAVGWFSRITLDLFKNRVIRENQSYKEYNSVLE